ncbi:MAG: SDR family NAD(P)-dependent oxidoreductase [Candidatus Nanohaloarchaea archaeon]
MEKALVTGGAGFIGSNIVEELVERGVDVVVLDDLYLGSEDNLADVRDRIEFVEGTVTDPGTVEEAVEGCDRVFHLAARSSAPMHAEEPAQGARVNIEGFINTIEAAKEAGVEKIVYASTSSMYGSVEPPHAEDKGEEPVNLYSASKMSREDYAAAYSRTSEIHLTGLRFFSVYGPHERAKGKFANIVSQFLWKIQEGESPKIFGDGTQTRDFTFVKDVVQANMKAAEIRDETDGEYFNVGTGEETTFNEVMDLLNEIMGTDVEAEHVENPIDNYVERTKADISRTREKLGWEPEHSFEEGLRKTVEYYTEQG